GLGLREVGVRVEALDAAREPRRVLRGVEGGDRSGTGPAREQGVPGGAEVEAERRDGAEPGDDDATSLHDQLRGAGRPRRTSGDRTVAGAVVRVARSSARM